MQGTGDQLDGGLVNLPAIAVCLLVTFIPSRGTQTFGHFELVAVGKKHIPNAILLSLAIAMSLYALATLVSINPESPRFIKVSHTE